MTALAGIEIVASAASLLPVQSASATTDVTMTTISSVGRGAAAVVAGIGGNGIPLSHLHNVVSLSHFVVVYPPPLFFRREFSGFALCTASGAAVGEVSDQTNNNQTSKERKREFSFVTCVLLNKISIQCGRYFFFFFLFFLFFFSLFFFIFHCRPLFFLLLTLPSIRSTSEMHAVSCL